MAVATAARYGWYATVEMAQPISQTLQRQRLQVIAETAMGPAIQTAAGAHTVERGPDNARAAALQILDQVAILMHRQRPEATHAPIGFGAHPKVGAVDMPMAFTALVQALVALAHLGRMLRVPLLDTHRAANRIGVECQLLAQPVARHSAVGVGAGEPACALIQQVGGAGAAGIADIAGVDGQGLHTAGAGDVPGAVGAGIQYHQDPHFFTGFVGRTPQRLEAVLEQGLFIVRGHHDANHRHCSSRSMPPAWRLQSSSRKSASR